MAFNARLDVNYSYTAGPKEIIVNAVFVDLTGVYTGDSLVPGSRIIQDATGWMLGQDMLVYELIENLGSSDEGVSYNLHARWALAGDHIELQGMFPTIVGEPDIDGAIDVPEANSQQSDVIAINRFRNYLLRAAKAVATANEFTIVDNVLVVPYNYKPLSLRVYRNGLRQRVGVDYTIDEFNNVIPSPAPEEDEVFVVEYARL